jgi:TolB-like protein
VAVLPFVPLSNGPDDDYFADGLSEEIINALAQVPDLLVTARTSAFHFKGQSLPVAEIAVQLGVAHVVEGSVRRAGDQLRITAQLVRADDGFHLWSQTYDRRAADTFAVQSDIAEQVARALNVLLDDASRERMQRVGTRDVEAFIAHQKGIELFERAHIEPNQISLLEQANVQFETAIERAPDLFPAYYYHSDLFVHALLSHAAGQLDGDVTDALLELAPRALASDLQRAVQHARTNAEHHRAEVSKALLMGPWRGLSLLTEAAATTSTCEAPTWLQDVAPFPGQAEPVLAALDRMGQCDPLRTRPVFHSTGLELLLGRPDAAAGRARAGLQRFEHPFLARQLSLAMAFGGDPEGAEAETAQRIRTEDERLLTFAMLAAVRGDAPAAARWQQDWLGVVGSDDRNSLVLEALRGNRNEANRLAGRIDARPFGHMVLLQAIYLCTCGAPFDLESTPVFASMLKDSGLEWPPVRPYDLPLKDW